MDTYLVGFVLYLLSQFPLSGIEELFVREQFLDASRARRFPEDVINVCMRSTLDSLTQEQVPPHSLVLLFVT